MPEPLLRLFAILDISRRSVPLDQVSPLIAQRFRANEEPAILSISAPQTHFIFVSFTNRHLRLPLLQDSWNVIRMDWARRIFDILLQRKAGIIQPTLIEKINDAVRPHAPGHCRNGVDYQTKMFFAAAHCLFSSTAFGDVLHGAKHANWLTRFVTYNFVTNMHKSDVAIRPHKSDFDIKEPLALQRLAEDLLMAPPVIGMNKLQQLSLVRNATERFQSQDTTGFFRPRDAVSD